jgi:hypothetical protein
MNLTGNALEPLGSHIGEDNLKGQMSGSENEIGGAGDR